MWFRCSIRSRYLVHWNESDDMTWCRGIGIYEIRCCCGLHHFETNFGFTRCGEMPIPKPISHYMKWLNQKESIDMHRWADECFGLWLIVVFRGCDERRNSHSHDDAVAIALPLAGMWLDAPMQSPWKGAKETKRRETKIGLCLTNSVTYEIRNNLTTVEWRTIYRFTSVAVRRTSDSSLIQFQCEIDDARTALKQNRTSKLVSFVPKTEKKNRKHVSHLLALPRHSTNTHSHRRQSSGPECCRM